MEIEIEQPSRPRVGKKATIYVFGFKASSLFVAEQASQDECVAFAIISGCTADNDCRANHQEDMSGQAKSTTHEP